MDYMTVSETADKWRVSKRWVHKYVKDGRVKGAVRFGAAWMIPADAVKPGDPRLKKSGGPRLEKSGNPRFEKSGSPCLEKFGGPRFDKASAQKTLQAAFDQALEAVHSPWPSDDPYKILDLMSNEKLRLVHEAAFAYMRGDFRQVRRCYIEVEGDDAAKLLVSAISIPAAISMGDYTFYLDAECWLKEIIAAELGGGVTAYAQYALAIGYMGAHAPDMIAEWIKKGDFADLHPLARFEAINRRADYLYYLQRFGSMRDATQAAMSILGLSHTVSHEKGFSLTEINLRLRCAVACHCLDRVDEARRWLMGAMNIALPHGFIASFAEMITLLGDLMEQCLNQAYPQWRDAVIEQANRILANWIDFHNLFTKDNITIILTLREMGIARLAVRHVPYKSIAEQYHISLGRLKSIMSEIYGKLYVHNREELSKFIP